ncbi:MAG: carbon starvation protein A, partial [Nitrospirales bacterium]|nr:carbon starvation protein A [Nitrospirales bacterium]
RYAWTTFIPMVFMFITTFTASWGLIGIFRAKAAAAPSPSDALSFRLDIFLVSLMMGLAAIALADMIYRWYCLLQKGGESVILSEAE